MTKPRLLVVGGGHAQLTLVEESKKLGCHTIVADERPEAPGRRLADDVLSLNRYDASGILRAAPDLRLDGVVSGGSDQAVHVMALCAEECGLSSYVSIAAAKMPMDKPTMRALLESLDLPVPRSIRLESGEQASEAARSLGYPVVVKPVDGIGQRGVHRVDDAASLLAKLDDARASSKQGRAMLEELVEGDELGINGFVISGRFRLLTVARRTAFRSGDAFGVALTKSYPAPEANEFGPLIERIVDRACRGLAIVNAPVYAQLMFRRGRPDPIRIIEIMPRLSGGEDPRLVHAATGFNTAKATVLAALGKPITDDAVVDGTRRKAVALRFLTVPRGRIAGVTGLGDALRSHDVLAADAFYGPGHRVDDLRSSRERVGYVLAAGESAAEAEAAAETGAKAIRFTMEPADDA